MPQIESSPHLIHERESSALDESPARSDEPKALRYFHTDTFWKAAGPARAVLLDAKSCPQCSRALARLYDRLGSTLFRDDHPQALIRAFDPEDQNTCTLWIVAACIVLYGRERLELTIH